MAFVCTLYILIIVFAENKGKSHAQCVSVFEETEVVHLSPQLHLSECSLLLKSANELIPERMDNDEANYEVLNKDLNCLLTTSKVYLVDIKRWTDDYSSKVYWKEDSYIKLFVFYNVYTVAPNTEYSFILTPVISNRKESGSRSTRQLTRKLLEHSDLVMYMNENQRPVNLWDAEDYHLANMLEFPEHKVVRRRRSKNNKHLSNKEKKKKKKRAHKDHPDYRKTQKKRIHGATGHAVAHRTHKLKKKEDKSRDEKCYLRQHQSLFISILFVSLFIVLCLVAAYYLHRRSRFKARGTRFKYNWAANKEDKHTLTDYVEWGDEAVCSCSDVDIGSAIKCPICNRFYRTSTDISNKYLCSLGVQKSKDKEKKKRFSFLQKSFQNKKKEKNLENRDWKKADEKAVLKKQEKFPSTFQGDQQCACCKCELHVRDKMIREKKEHKRKVMQKLKAKKRKEKKRRKDEIRKAEKCANICFKDNCK